MYLERLNIEDVDWAHLDSFHDRSVYQTQAWLRFLESTQTCTPVIAALKEDRDVLGFFTGCVFRRFGLRFLGSPFPGWSTAYMGFNVLPGVSRTEALKALPAFAFKELDCVHMEVMDRRLTTGDIRDLGYQSSNFAGYEIDLTLSEDKLFANMDSDYRRCTRKAEKNGVTIEEASDSGFADDYYNQLREVFAKQGLVPTYSLSRVHSLLSHLRHTGMLLTLRARDADGLCIATGIFVGANDTAYYWGGASLRQFQILRPNHAIQWHAIRYWKDRNMEKYDMGGGGRYKANFGGAKIAVPWIRMSRYSVLDRSRNAYKYIHRKRQELSGWLVRRSQRSVS